MSGETFKHHPSIDVKFAMCNTIYNNGSPNYAKPRKQHFGQMLLVRF